VKSPDASETSKPSSLLDGGFVVKHVFSLPVKAAIALIWPALVFGQRGVPQTRIRQPIDRSQLKVLAGNTHPFAKAQFDQGVAPDDLPMERMMLVLTRSAEQQANLDRLLTDLVDPGSPRFHQWLTPEQFGQQFGASDQDLQTVTSWLSSEGFQVEQPTRGRTVIEFSGTAGQVASAFHTKIHRYRVSGAEHWANASDPEIPTALAPVVAGVASLHNFTKRPQSRDYGLMTGNAGLLSSPAFTSSSGSHALSPSDFATIYNVNPAYQSGINGSGVTIAVVARSNLNLADVTNFRSLFGLASNPPQVVINGVDPGNRGGGEETEVVLDAAWSGAVAPNATVKVVVSKSTNAADGVDLSEAYIINNNLADVMTESFGSCEASYTRAQAAAASSLAAQAAAQGITYLVSTGDSGSSECSAASSQAATGSISVNTLAANPYVIAVGGTQLNDSAGGYWNPSNSATRGSAMSYIPENVWNESCSVAQCGASGAGLWASGGGASIFYPKPSWQSDVPGIPNDGARDIPDVSLAASGHNPYLVCVRNSCASNPPSFSGVAGTSASAPAFAGIMALMVQRAQTRQGQANATLYRLAGSQNMGACNASAAGGVAPNCVFNDVTSGNNAVPGQANYGTPNAKYQANVGYDLTTGLGSVNVANLMNAWTVQTLPSGTPVATLSAAAVDFGAVSVGVTATRTINFANSGTADLAIGSIGVTSNGAGVFEQTNNCPSVLVPGGICAISLAFLPQSAGQFGASLTITDNANGSPQGIPLTGSGAGSPALTLSPSFVDFGTRKLQVRTGTETIEIANSSTQAVVITGISLLGTNASDFNLANTCGTALLSGQSCSIFVVFTPQSLGSRSASVLINSSLPGSPQTVQLNGSGILTGAFDIVSRISGKVLDLVSPSSGNGGRIQQSYFSGQTQQQWIFYPVDNGFYYILNAATGKALDNIGASLSNGTGIQQWDYLGGIQQQWTLVPVDDVYFAIFNRWSSKALDVTGASGAAGTLIQQWDGNGSSQQIWSLMPADSYQFVNENSGLVLDAPSGSTANGTLVQQYAGNGANQQQWQLLPSGGGYYGILNRQTGKALDVTSASPDNGAPIQEYDFINGPNQQWRFELVDGTYWKVVSRSTGKVLDVVNASMANTAGLQQWSYLGGRNQLWQVAPVSQETVPSR